jgi:hypothetical protein
MKAICNYKAIVVYIYNHLSFKLEVQILTQASNNEPNPELWLKQKEYYWICKLGTSTNSKINL